jgi:hypothetical protein
MRQKLKNKIICWSIMCKTSAVTRFNKLINHSWCFTCPDYTYNRSIDTVVDIMSTEFSGSIREWIFFNRYTRPTSTLSASYSDNLPDRSPAYFNNYLDAVHYLPCFSLLISVLINIISAKCPSSVKPIHGYFNNVSHFWHTSIQHTQHEMNCSIYIHMWHTR